MINAPSPYPIMFFTFTLQYVWKFSSSWTLMCQWCWCSPTRHTAPQTLDLQEADPRKVYPSKVWHYTVSWYIIYHYYTIHHHFIHHSMMHNTYCSCTIHDHPLPYAFQWLDTSDMSLKLVSRGKTYTYGRKQKQVNDRLQWIKRWLM